MGWESLYLQNPIMENNNSSFKMPKENVGTHSSFLSAVFLISSGWSLFPWTHSLRCCSFCHQDFFLQDIDSFSLPYLLRSRQSWKCALILDAFSLYWNSVTMTNKSVGLRSWATLSRKEGCELGSPMLKKAKRKPNWHVKFCVCKQSHLMFDPKCCIVFKSGKACFSP